MKAATPGALLPLPATWVLALGAAAVLADETSAKPNIIFILADDLGYGDVGCYNPESKIPTPNIDKLAGQGLRFTDAHTPSGVCSPTRYGVLTGRYCWRTWLKRGVLMGFSPPLIEPGRLTVAGLLKQHGYATAAVGKWHVGMTFTRKDGKPITAPDRGPRDGTLIDFSVPIQGGPTTLGFDDFFGCAACPTTDWLYSYIHNGRTVGVPNENWPGTPGGPDHDFRGSRAGIKSPEFDFETVDLVLAEKSVQFIRDHVEKTPHRPFFLYHASQTPHLPAWPAGRFVGKSRAGNLGDFIHEFDWVVGQIVDAVDRAGIGERTLILVTSDNGPEIAMWFVKQEYGHDGAHSLRGMKRDNWEGGHRVPLVARWPGKIKPGTTSDEVICLTDLMATCAAIVGADLPPDAGEDSYNMLPALLGETLEGPIREATVHHSVNGDFAIRQGRWKLILHRGSGSGNYEGKWMGKIPVDPPITDPDAPGQLYDLSRDRGETNNLYRSHPEVVRRLTALLERYKTAGRSRP